MRSGRVQAFGFEEHGHSPWHPEFYAGWRVNRRVHIIASVHARSASDVGSGTAAAERLPAPLPEVLPKRVRHSV